MIEKDNSKEINSVTDVNSRLMRILSMFLDYLFMSFAIVPFAIILFILISKFENDISENMGRVLIWIPFFIYFNKDFFNSKSFAKRILGFEIVDNSTDKPANEFQCFLRNLTIIAWPIETVFGFINPKRRLGDYIANTRVEKADKEDFKSLLSDIKKTTINKNLIWIIGVGIIYFYLISYLIFPNILI